MAVDGERWMGSSVSLPVRLTRQRLLGAEHGAGAALSEDEHDDGMGGDGVVGGHGVIAGRVGWDPATAAYFAELDLFPSGVDPVWVRPTRLGGGLGRYVTIDALRNGLALRGHHLCGRSLDRLDRLRDLVERRWGEVIVEGSAAPGGGWLDLVLPDGRRLNLRTDIEIAHDSGPDPGPDSGPDPCPGWSADLVRALVRRVWSERWGVDEELFADGLRLLLDERAGSRIRIGAGALCDWYLLDPPPRSPRCRVRGRFDPDRA